MIILPLNIKGFHRFDFIWGMIWCENPSYFGRNSTCAMLFYIGEILGFVGKILDVKDSSTSGEPLTMISGMIWWPNPSYLNEIPLALCFFTKFSLWNYFHIGEILGFVGKFLDVKDSSHYGEPLTMIWGIIWWANSSYFDRSLPNPVSETTLLWYQWNPWIWGKIFGYEGFLTLWRTSWYLSRSVLSKSSLQNQSFSSWESIWRKFFFWTKEIGNC